LRKKKQQSWREAEAKKLVPEKFHR